MKLWQKMAILIILPLLLEVGYIVAIKNNQAELNQEYLQERKSQDTIILIQRALKCCLDPLTYLMNYKSSGTTGSVLERKRASESLDELRTLRKRIELAQEKPNQFAHIMGTMESIEKLLEEAINARNSNDQYSNPTDFMKVTKLGRTIIAITQQDIETADAAHKQKLLRVTAKQEEFDSLLLTAVIVSGGIVFFLLGVFAVGIRRQLEILTKNSENLALGKSLLPPMQGNDELSNLDKRFHRMASSISELTERESAILKNSGELIFSINSKLRFSFVNDAVVKILAMSPEEFVGKYAANVLASCMENIEKAKTTNEDQTFDAVINDKDGNEIELQIAVTWSEAEQSYFCVAHDVGARREIERMKQNFMAMVSHDLRTPVSANLATLDLLKMDPTIGELTDRGRTLIERTITSNTRLITMVNDLLEMERLDAGKVNIEKELVTFNDLVEEALSSVEMVAQAKSIAITHDDSNEFFYCHSSRIVQVLVNLLGNAVKFSQPGQPINIEFSQDDTYSSILVKDNGPGIPKEELKNLFDRFKQVRDASGAHKQGFGLGLEICKKLVELHDGEIIVSSEPGKGSSFEVRLPRHKSTAP
ncbi:MAG: hypothetical protein C0469_15970 [Cyanobacteria bacterium DS2.3.42]|nr:hypothetical protein [Cyanobacteria bacterium DS2.3.42]